MGEAKWRHAVATGNADAVASWLEHLGLSEHVAAFKREGVDGKMLATLSDDELELELGVGSLLHRRRMLLEIEALAAAVREADGIARVRRLSMVGHTSEM